MIDTATRLKYLLQQRHWQTYGTFCKEYDKAAQSIDKDLVGTWPSRAQLHRWLSGGLKGLPYASHCRVLEGMFPGWSADRLFERCLPEEAADATHVLDAISTGLNESGTSADPVWKDSSAVGVHGTIERPQSSRSMTLEGFTDRSASATSADQPTQQIARKLMAAKKVLRLSQDETTRLACIAGNVVELGMELDIDIDPDGHAQLMYQHHVMNLTERPLTRFARGVWFKHTRDSLEIAPLNVDDRRVTVQRVHDTANLAKFACQFSPAVQPGDMVRFGFTCDGGQFLTEHYWREAIHRYTRHLTITIRHRDAGSLSSCMATEEHASGSEHSVTEDLMWDVDGNDVILTLTRDYLSPNQAVTARWEVTSAAS